MKRILLVSPPFYRLLGSHYNGINLGISYISSVLNQNGFQSCIYNADYVNSEDQVDQVGLVSAYDDYERIISDMNHPIWQECVKNILDYKPVYQINVPRVDTINTMRYQRMQRIKKKCIQRFYKIVPSQKIFLTSISNLPVDDGVPKQFEEKTVYIADWQRKGYPIWASAY